MARLTYKRSATKVLQRMDRATRERIAEALDKLEADPDRQDLDITPLAGTGGFRLRIAPFTAPTYPSCVPKSLKKVIIPMNTYCDRF